MTLRALIRAPFFIVSELGNGYLVICKRAGAFFGNEGIGYNAQFKKPFWCVADGGIF